MFRSCTEAYGYTTSHFDKNDKKGLGGEGKLTARLIDDLIIYYGLSIRRNYNSIDMGDIVP